MRTSTLTNCKAILALASLTALALGNPASAAVVYESATLGVPTAGGLGLYDSQFLGAKFHLDLTTQVTSIGGNIGGTGSLFGAIVSLSSPASIPLGYPLLPSEVVAYGTFEARTEAVSYTRSPVSVEQALDLSVLLEPGDYGVVFGSGLFGATGSGWMASSTQQTYSVIGVGKSTAIGTPDYFFYSDFGFGIPTSWTDRDFSGDLPQVRFFVNGDAVVQASPVPEPEALALWSFGLLAVLTLRHRNARRGKSTAKSVHV